MSVGPFTTRESYRQWAASAAGRTDPRFYAVVDQVSGYALGTVSLMRQDLANGVVEIGNIVYSKRVQRTPISTEVQYLLMRYVFDELGNRRYEWKCDSLNAPSRRAAARLRVTPEWPRIREGFEAWLDPANFDAEGHQHHPLTTR